MKSTDKQMLNPHEIAKIYDELFEDQGRLHDTNTFYAWVLKRLAPETGSTLLDVGCGQGVLLEEARKIGLLGTGIDLSFHGTRLAHDRLKESIVSIANGEQLPFAEQSFDFVTNIGSLEHFIDPAVGVKEIARVLKTTGQAALVLPNRYYLVDIIWQVWRTGYSATHRQPVERFASYREWWECLEQGGLRVLKASKYNFCFPRTKADFHWYRQHPKKILNVLVSPFIPFNLSYHFLYICARQ